jgi:hypothetical protein
MNVSAEVFLIAGAVYLVAGGLFAGPFAWIGARKIDLHAAAGTWGFRLIIIPGAMLLWPWLAWRWRCSVGCPQPTGPSGQPAALGTAHATPDEKLS